MRVSAGSPVMGVRGKYEVPLGIRNEVTEGVQGNAFPVPHWGCPEDWGWAAQCVSIA